MSISLTSRETYFIDVPEVENFNVKFRYNFYVSNEQISDEITVPDFLATKQSKGFFDPEYFKLFNFHVPRYMTITWKSLKLGNNISDEKESNKLVTPDQAGVSKNLISKNIDKVLTEDEFSSANFFGITFQDSQLFNKLQNMLKYSSEIVSDVPMSDNDFETIAMDSSTFGATYYKTGKQPITGVTKKLLESVNINTQINSRHLYEICQKISEDPQSPYTDDVKPLMDASKKYKDTPDTNFNNSDYAPAIDYISVSPASSNGQSRGVPQVVGYIIDKYEIDAKRNIVPLDPIIIENSSVNFYVDTRIKYNHTYVYSIRSVLAISVPAINSTNGKMSTITFLVSSKPSGKLWISTLENKAPPPPVDINFAWDYGRQKLIVNWCFPVNPQYDIKRFQIFRRKKIEHPFQLIKEYNFDDSAVKMNVGEFPDEKLVEHLENPITYYIDDDFTKDSKYIYTVTSIDAHGLTSNYGAQFEISFDRFKNILIKKLISQAGAPKPYPNMYLKGTGFANLMKVSGEYSKKMKIYCAPHNKKYLYVKNNNKEVSPIFETDASGGNYKIQVLNLDNQKGETITINIKSSSNQKILIIICGNCIRNKEMVKHGMA